MNEEDRALLATKIKGWSRLTHHEKYLRLDIEEWVQTDGRPVMVTAAWHPDTDILQAFMLMEAIGKMKFQTQRCFMQHIRDQPRRERYFGEPLEWFLFAANKPKALAEAALEVARAMEKEDSK